MTIDRLARFLRRPRSDHRLVFEALLWLFWAKLLLVMTPFRWIAPRLGRQMTESSDRVDEAQRQLAGRIGWAVGGAARNVPFGFVCLPQAIAAKWMLRRRGLPSTLYLGLRRHEEVKLTAHAWLRVGENILTGRAESRHHQVIATFSD